MRKKDKMKYFEYEEELEESPYDFSAVKLRGEGHVEGFYDDIESFSFDDDSYGELPFEDDEELVEEDFSLKSVTEKYDEKAFDIDVSKDEGIKNTEELYDDLFDFGDDGVSDIPEEPDIDSLDIVEKPVPETEVHVAPPDLNKPVEVVKPKNLPEKSTSETMKTQSAKMPKIRTSALQPLLVINRSKHSFGSGKKKQETKEVKTDLEKSEEFDSFKEGVLDTMDDDIADISETLDVSVDSAVEDVSSIPEDSHDNISEEILENDISETVLLEDTISSAELTDSVMDNNIDADVLTVDEIDDTVSSNTIENDILLDEVDSSFIAEDNSLLDDSAVSDINEPTEIIAESATASDEDIVEEKASVDSEKLINEKRLLRKKKKRKKMVKNLVREVISWVLLVVIAFAIAIVVNLYVARPSIVSGTSMMPTLNNGDTIVISKLPYMLGDVEYGDIVVIDRSADRDRTFAVELTESLKYNALTQSLFDKNELSDDVFWVKRIIGKPGDVIEFLDGKVYRNGELLIEDYILTQDVDMYLNGQQVIVKEGCIFVMGDNRNASLDSRALATHGEQIEMDHIVGKLISK